MGKSIYNKLIPIIENMKREKDIFTKNEVLEMIVKNFGSDSRTFKNVLNTIRFSKLMQPSEDEKLWTI